MESVVKFRNSVNGAVYRNVVKPTAFMFDAEAVHKFFIAVGKRLGKHKLGKKVTRVAYYYENDMLSQKLLGIDFTNPIGLSAGFDKNAEIVSICEDVGFGFSEVGSVSAKYCAGNPGVRLERIREKESLWVNLGLNNDGVDEIGSRLSGKKYGIPYGVSIAKTNCAETADDDAGIRDYCYTLKKLNELNVGKFYVINISCPNSFGGQPFSRPLAYEKLLKELMKTRSKKPIFVKLSPDIDRRNIDSIIKISRKYKIAGFICSNLTKKHDLGKGGLSGKAVEKASDELLSYVYSRTRGEFVLIAVGGVFSAQDAYKKIKLGANLVELITGMIYNGPNLISEINQGLVSLLREDGYDDICEARGKDVL